MKRKAIKLLCRTRFLRDAKQGEMRRKEQVLQYLPLVRAPNIGVKLSRDIYLSLDN